MRLASSKIGEISAIYPNLADGQSLNDNMSTVIEKFGEAYGGLNISYTEMKNYVESNRVSLPFANLFLIIILIIDGITVTAYWVFEVFRNREKCKKLNSENS